MTQPETMRVFFALWPPGNARAELAGLQRTVALACDGRVQASDKLHLTLAFLGAVPLETIPQLIEIGRDMPPLRCVMSIDKLGFWARSQVLWAGCSVPPAALLDWVSVLNARLHSAGFPLESRPFAPHITLLRAARMRGALPACEPAIEWAVEGFSLVASEAAESGSVYRTLWSSGQEPA